jgi:hypothetical protein
MFIKCPHCNIDIEVMAVQCGIFRCGILKSTYQQIPPHSKKDKCDKLVEDGLIFGCGRPFHINNPNHIPVKCDYI